MGPRGSSLTAFGAGKVILLGEHAVVYGHPAVAAPLPVGVTAHAKAARECKLVVPPALPQTQRALLRHAFARVAEACGRPNVRVRLESELPFSMGLGSSAAVSVACARVLLEAKADGKPATPAKVAALAYEMECVFHGTPSGIDHTTSAEGRLIRFVRSGSPGSRVQVRHVRSPKPLWLIIALAGKRGSTREMVSGLRARMTRWPKRYARLFEDIGSGVEEGVNAIERGDLQALGDVMNVNHGLLHALGLSSPPVDTLVHGLRAAGALGAKLSGAGGTGGATIALFREPRGVVARLQRMGISAFATQVAGPGVD